MIELIFTRVYFIVSSLKYYIWSWDILTLHLRVRWLKSGPFQFHDMQFMMLSSAHFINTVFGYASLHSAPKLRVWGQIFMEIGNLRYDSMVWSETRSLFFPINIYQVWKVFFIVSTLALFDPRLVIWSGHEEIIVDDFNLPNKNFPHLNFPNIKCLLFMCDKRFH